ncbi:protein YgfY [Aeromonas salmonicida]|nr:protein YgfY [Aeromonas salmonicida]
MFVSRKIQLLPSSGLCKESSMLSPIEKSRLKWACRRGMLELDVIFMPFFEHEFDSLSDEQQQTFIRLLESDDPDLFKWCMGHGVPADPAFAAMIALILERNQARHDSLS